MRFIVRLIRVFFSGKCSNLKGMCAVYYLILFTADVMLMRCCVPVPHRVRLQPHLQTPFEMFVIYPDLGYG